MSEIPGLIDVLDGATEETCRLAEPDGPEEVRRNALGRVVNGWFHSLIPPSVLITRGVDVFVKAVCGTRNRTYRLPRGRSSIC